MRRIDAPNKKLKPAKRLVIYWGQFMPRIGGKNLYLMIKPGLQEHGIKLGRDCLFDYLREHDFLVKPKKNYTKTTHVYYGRKMDFP
jgi:hypothetical protein